MEVEDGGVKEVRWLCGSSGGNLIKRMEGLIIHACLCQAFIPLRGSQGKA